MIPPTKAGRSRHRAGERDSVPAQSVHPDAEPSSHARAAAGNLAVSRLLGAHGVQAKLTVSQPGEPEEDEADRVADAVVNRSPVPAIQRKCATCASGEPCASCDEDGKIQRKPNTSGSSRDRLTDIRTAIGHGGAPLPRSVRAMLEPRFGASFSHVRVHTDSQAQHSALALQARAFTTGHHVVFAPGEYAPHNREGQRLLAHELTHVIQQGGHTGSSGITHQSGSASPGRTHIARKAVAAPNAVIPPGENPASLHSGLRSRGHARVAHNPRVMNGTSRLAAPADDDNGSQAPAAERQADQIGARIGAELGGVAVSSGPLPHAIQTIAETHLGVGLGGTRLRADAEGDRTAREAGALAVAQGRTVSFKAGQLSTTTSEGQRLIGHELVHVGQQRATGRVMRQRAPDPEDQARVVTALQTKQMTDVLKIKDVNNATVEQRVQLFAILYNSSGSGSSVMEIELRYWHSFGEGLGGVIEAHADVWDASLKAHPVLGSVLWQLPTIQKLRGQFIGDLEQLATNNLFANRGYVIARQEMLGLSGPSPNALKPELLTKLRVNLQDEAYKVYGLRQRQEKLKAIQIGFSGDGIGMARVFFDPTNPPESISMFKRRSGLFDRTERPEWSDLKLIWDTAANEIGRVAAEYPEIYAAVAKDSPQAVLDLSRLTADAFGSNAKALLDSLLTRIDSAQRLINEHKIDMLDLKQLVLRVLNEKGVTGRNWTAGFERRVALHVVEEHAQSAKDLSQLLDSVQMVAMVATIIPGVGLGARLIAGGIAVGVEAGRGAAEWNKGTNLGQVARATPLSGTELVDRSEADKIRTDGVLKMVDAAVNAALLFGPEAALKIGGIISGGLAQRAARLKAQNATKVTGNTHLEDEFAKLEEALKDPKKAGDAAKQLDNIEAELALEEPPIVGDTAPPSASVNAPKSGPNWGIPEGGVPAAERLNQPGVTVPDYVLKNPELYYFQPGAAGKPGRYLRRTGFPERTGKGHEIPCFAAGTMVSTPAGPRAIETLASGDMVLTFEEWTGDTVVRPVIERHCSTTDWLYHVGTPGGSVASTGEHLFYVGAGDWRCARDLTSDTPLRDTSGAVRQVRRVAVEASRREATYNLAIAEHPHYFVGPDAVLVHNSGPYGIYLGIDPKTGKVIYVGQTSQDLAVRQAQHQAEGRATGTETPWKKDMVLEWAKGADGQPLTGLSEAEAYYHERLTWEAKGGGALKNRQVPYTDAKMAAAIEANCPK